MSFWNLEFGCAENIVVEYHSQSGPKRIVVDEEAKSALIQAVSLLDADSASDEGRAM